MKTTGTIDEWIAKKPDAILTNRNFLQADVSIRGFRKVPKYESSAPFGSVGSEVVLIAHGRMLCPYIEKRKFRYICNALYPTGGTPMPLTDYMANDPNWEEK